MLFAIGNHRAYASFGIEPRNACTAGAAALCERTLRIELKLKLAIKILALKLFVLAYIGGNHLLDLTVLKQEPKAEPVYASIVGNDGQVLHARLANGFDKKFWNAAQTKSAGHNSHPIEQQTV